VFFSVFLAILFSLLVFGPATVLNGLFGSATLCFSISYALPIGLTAGKLARLPVQRYCNRGVFGTAVNALALALLIAWYAEELSSQVNLKCLKTIGGESI
jgi:hypothetical protein